MKIVLDTNVLLVSISRKSPYFPIFSALLNLYGELAGFLEDFLTFSEMNHHPFIKDYLLINRYSQEIDNHLFFQAIEAAKQRLQYGKNLDSFTFLKKLILHHLSYFKTNSTQYLINGNNLDISFASSNLNKFNELLELEYNVEKLNRSKLFSNITEEIEEDKSPEFDKILSLKKSEQSLIEKKSKTAYHQLKKIFFDNIDSLSLHEKSITYTYLINFLINTIKNGELESMREVFELYKRCYTEKLLTLNGHLSSVQYLNILNIASHLEEYEWLDEFMTSYNKNIKRSNSYNLQRLGEAQILFKKEKYDKALDILISVKYQNPYFMLIANSLTLRCYYMINTNKEFLFDYTRAFIERVRRSNRINFLLKEGYLSFLTIFKELILGKASSEDLNSKIINSKNLKNRGWLLEVLKRKKSSI